MQPERTAAQPRPGVVLAVVSAATFMGVLDIAIVNVALPSIQRQLGLSVSSLQWVVTAYAEGCIYWDPAADLVVFGAGGQLLRCARVHHPWMASRPTRLQVEEV